MIYAELNVNGQTLVIRSLRPSDAEVIANYWTKLSDEECASIGIDKSLIPGHDTICEQMKRISSQTDHAYAENWAIIVDVDNKPGAMALATEIVHGDTAEVEFYIFESSLRRAGIAQAVAQEIIQLFFEMFNLQTLYARPSINNKAAISLLEKLGRKKHGLEKKPGTPLVISGEVAVYCWNDIDARKMKADS